LRQSDVSEVKLLVRLKLARREVSRPQQTRAGRDRGSHPKSPAL
jgi:hypothetical protein